MTRREALAALLCGPVAVAKSLHAQGTDLTAMTIAEASRRLASRTITPLQLTNAYLARIATLNPSLNAFVTVTADLARREAKALPDPRTTLLPRLYGIPIAHKDLFETKGVRTTAGSLLFEDYIPDVNAAIVQQLENAGAVLLGKTNTHELGGGVTTINPFFGTTRNPVDHTRIPGGSSGGSAAAVVARLCAAATGSDTGGSVRIPAALCGCVGFKPTHGRFSTQGLIAASPSFDHIGFLTRTVEDAQLVAGLNPSKLPAHRIGVARRYFFDDLDQPVASAINPIVSKYPDIDFPVDAKTMARVFNPVFAFEMWSRFGADWRTNPGSFSKSMAGFFATPRPSIGEYEEGLAAVKEYQAAVDKLFDSVDVILTPTVPIVAPPITGPIDSMKILRNTWPLNAAGTPAVSIPLKSTGLPVGLQLIARRGEDDKLLQIARDILR
ncbi:MAG TPA: amidase [Vicinamibacterales bacterium]|nr:amidase [Vicinamibacterales bacterium]